MLKLNVTVSPNRSAAGGSDITASTSDGTTHLVVTGAAEGGPRRSRRSGGGAAPRLALVQAEYSAVLRDLYAADPTLAPANTTAASATPASAATSAVSPFSPPQRDRTLEPAAAPPATHAPAQPQPQPQLLPLATDVLLGVRRELESLTAAGVSTQQQTAIEVPRLIVAPYPPPEPKPAPPPATATPTVAPTPVLDSTKTATPPVTNAAATTTAASAAPEPLPVLFTPPPAGRTGSSSAPASVLPVTAPAADRDTKHTAPASPPAVGSTAFDTTATRPASVTPSHWATALVHVPTLPEDSQPAPRRRRRRQRVPGPHTVNLLRQAIAPSVSDSQSVAVSSDDDDDDGGYDLPSDGDGDDSDNRVIARTTGAADGVVTPTARAAAEATVAAAAIAHHMRQSERDANYLLRMTPQHPLVKARLTRIVHAWADQSVIRRRQIKAVEVLQSCDRRRLLSLCWSGWSVFVSRRRALRVSLRSTVTAHTRHQLQSAWNLWKQAASDQQRATAFARVFALKRVVISWRRHASTIAAHRTANERAADLHGRTLSMNILTKWLSHAIQQRRTARAAVIALREWRRTTSIQRVVRAVVTRRARLHARNAWCEWRAFTFRERNRAARLKRLFAVWRLESRARRKRRLLFVALLQKRAKRAVVNQFRSNHKAVGFERGRNAISDRYRKSHALRFWLHRHRTILKLRALHSNWIATHVRPLNANLTLKRMWRAWRRATRQQLTMYSAVYNGQVRHMTRLWSEWRRRYAARQQTEQFCTTIVATVDRQRATGMLQYWKAEALDRRTDRILSAQLRRTAIRRWAQNARLQRAERQRSALVQKCLHRKLLRRLVYAYEKLRHVVKRRQAISELVQRATAFDRRRVLTHFTRRWHVQQTRYTALRRVSYSMDRELLIRYFRNWLKYGQTRMVQLAAVAVVVRRFELRRFFRLWVLVDRYRRVARVRSLRHWIFQWRSAIRFIRLRALFGRAQHHSVTALFRRWKRETQHQKLLRSLAARVQATSDLHRLQAGWRMWIQEYNSSRARTQAHVRFQRFRASNAIRQWRATIKSRKSAVRHLAVAREAVSQHRERAALAVWKGFVLRRRRIHNADTRLATHWPQLRKRFWLRRWAAERHRHATLIRVCRRAADHLLRNGASQLLSHWRSWARRCQYRRTLLAYAVRANQTTINRGAFNHWRRAFAIRRIEHDLAFRVAVYRKRVGLRGWLQFLWHRRQQTALHTRVDAMHARHAVHRVVVALRTNAARAKRLRIEHTAVVANANRLSKRRAVRHIRTHIHALKSIREFDRTKSGVAYAHFERRAFMGWKAVTKRFQTLRRISAVVESAVALKLLKRCAFRWIDMSRRATKSNAHGAVLMTQSLEVDRRRMLFHAFMGWCRVHVTRKIRKWKAAHVLRRWRDFVSVRHLRSEQQREMEKRAVALRQSQIRRAAFRMWGRAYLNHREMKDVLVACDQYCVRHQKLRAVKAWRTFSGRRTRHRTRDVALTKQLTTVHSRRHLVSAWLHWYTTARVARFMRLTTANRIASAKRWAVDQLRGLVQTRHRVNALTRGPYVRVHRWTDLRRLRLVWNRWAAARRRVETAREQRVANGVDHVRRVQMSITLRKWARAAKDSADTRSLHAELLARANRQTQLRVIQNWRLVVRQTRVDRANTHAIVMTHNRRVANRMWLAWRNAARVSRVVGRIVRVLSTTVKRIHFTRWFDTAKQTEYTHKLTSGAVQVGRVWSLKRAVRQWRSHTTRAVAHTLRIAALNVTAARCRAKQLTTLAWKRWLASARFASVVAGAVRRADAYHERRVLRTAIFSWTNRLHARRLYRTKWLQLLSRASRAVRAQQSLSRRLAPLTDVHGGTTSIELLRPFTFWCSPPLKMLFQSWKNWSLHQANTRHARRFHAWQTIRYHFRAWRHFVSRHTSHVVNRMRVLNHRGASEDTRVQYVIGTGTQRMAAKLAALQQLEVSAKLHSRGAQLRRLFEVWRGRHVMTNTKLDEFRRSRPAAMALVNWLKFVRQRVRRRIARQLADDAYICFLVRRHFFGWLQRFASTPAPGDAVATRLRIGQIREQQLNELGAKAYVCFAVRRSFYAWRNGFLRLKQIS